MTIKEFKYQYALGTLSKNDLIRVAKKSTSKYILTTLSNNEDRDVRKWVALNSKAPKNALIKLSKDGNYNIRRWVADNPNAPIEALITLSEDDYWYIRKRVSQNPNTPTKIVSQFEDEANAAFDTVG